MHKNKNNCKIKLRKIFLQKFLQKVFSFLKKCVIIFIAKKKSIFQKIIIMTFGKFILGILIAGVGFLITWKSEWLLNNFGRLATAEKYLSGGTRLGYKLIGIFLIIIGLLYATDLTGKLIATIANTVFSTNIQVE